MNRQIFIATLLYTLSIVTIFGLVYNLLNSSSLSIIIVSTIFLSLVFGYTLNSYILSQKFSSDENLLHITKEILHELNIPISTIRANSLLLKKSLNGSERSLKRLQRIENSTERLERLYSELVYSIKKEIESVEKERFELMDLVESRVSEFRSLNRNLFILDLEPLTIKVDRIGFEKMLDNIISNAMKYSDKREPITITLKGAILTIKDRGVGIDETELIRIYDRYYQSDSTVHGDGIGLALVKAYCDTEKIKIKISSQKGLGTKVIFDLYRVLD
jgi:signal transduction histidine kinase